MGKRNMRIEAAYISRRPVVSAPLVLIMLRPQETCWRHHRLKILVLFLCSLVVMQYFFGASVYNLRLGDFVPLPRNGSNSLSTNLLTLGPTAESAVSKSFYENLTALKPVEFISPAPFHTITFIPQQTEKGSTGVEPVMVTTTLGSLLKNSTVLIRNGMSGQNSDLPLCPVVPPVLVGPIRVWFDYPSFGTLEELYPYLEKGGHGKPKTCLARHRVAIIIPYRDREKHLRGFLHNMHSLLTKQQLDYAIVVVDQIANQTFNRAKLMNVGYVESLKLYDFQCFIFHDVDLFPEDDRNIYSCPEQPRHMSVAIDKFKYRLPYTDIFGGITALTKEQFKKVNGFSNLYWGWGGEDDDMAIRVKLNGYHISRYPANIAKYRMVKHDRENTNPVNKCRYKLLYKAKTRWKEDGLNSLSYKINKLDLNTLYTRIVVDLNENQRIEELNKFGFSC